MEKTGFNVRFDKEVNQLEFWILYFQCYKMNISKEKQKLFPPFVIAAAAVIMDGDPDKSPLKGKQRKELVKKLNELGYRVQIGNISTRVVEPLLKLNIIYKSEDDLANGEYSINKHLKQMQRIIRAEGELTVPIYFNTRINGSS